MWSLFNTIFINDIALTYNLCDIWFCMKVQMKFIDSLLIVKWPTVFCGFA